MSPARSLKGVKGDCFGLDCSSLFERKRGFFFVGGLTVSKEDSKQSKEDNSKERRN
jgi:hypothetical protein